MSALEDSIIRDIYENARGFLPGKPCSEGEVVASLDLPILVDGLTREESALILSCLPRLATGVFLAPLDKGLSGSKVFAAKYDVEKRRVSKIFVLKLGPAEKTLREFRALRDLVAPHIAAVTPPICRVGKDLALVAQELAGLSYRDELTSLRLHARESRHADASVYRLFRERLGSWYGGGDDEPIVERKLGALLAPNLKKGPRKFTYPSTWTEIQRWAKAASHVEWDGAVETVRSLRGHSIRTRETIIHGDLHSQNVLIDDHSECWPIDFAWCREGGSAIVDLTMLECSLKFLSIPQRSDLRSLLRIENRLCRDMFPALSLGAVPYRREIENVLRAVAAIRRVATEDMGFSVGDYMRALCLLTYTLSTHPKLNRPYVLGSLQMLTGVISRGSV